MHLFAKPYRTAMSALAAATIYLFCAVQASAEVPPRFYWKTLSGTNAVPIIGMSVSGNANPLDPSRTVNPQANIEADIAIAGYAKILPISDRSGMLAVLVPMGNITGDFNVGGLTTSESSRGFGDPMLEFNMNLIGPPPIKSIPDLLRYEPGFSMDLIVDLAIPIGQYDNTQTLNLGQNRIYGRVGAPIVWQIGPWISHKRTTLELFPSIWFFGDNDDFAGQLLETDPSFELDAHLMRNLTSTLWGSLDAIYYNGGKSKIDGISTDDVSTLGAGFTLGYQLNDSMQLTFGYRTTLNNDSASTDLQLSTFMISFVAGWHPLLEGVRRLERE